MPVKTWAVGYCRMSTDEQDTSIEIQKAAILAYMQKRGLTLLRWYEDEGKSGDDRRGRKALESMLSDAARLADFEIVVISDQDRFSRFKAKRFMWYMQAFEDAGLTLESAAQGLIEVDSVAGGITSFVKAHADHEYLASNAAKATGGIINAIKNKGVVAKKSYFGVRMVWTGEKTPRRAEIVPEQHAELKALCRRILEGWSLNACVRDLNQRGVRTPGGAKYWAVGVLKKILMNEAYLGTNIWGKAMRGKRIRVRAGEMVKEPDTGVRRPTERQEKGDCLVVEDALPQLIDSDTFHAVQAVLQQASHKKSGRSFVYPLSGLLWCSCCKGRCNGHVSENRTGTDVFLYYKCRNRKHVAPRQPHPCRFSIPAATLEARVVEDILLNFLGDEQIQAHADDLREYLLDRQATHRERDRELTRELARLDQRIQKLDDLLEDLDRDMLDGTQRKIREARQQRATVEMALAAEQRIGQATVESIATTADDIIARLRSLRAMVTSPERETARRAFHMLVERIDLITVKGTGKKKLGVVKEIRIKYRRDLLCPTESFPHLLANWTQRYSSKNTWDSTIAMVDAA